VFAPDRESAAPLGGLSLERRIDGTYYVFRMHATCASASGRYALRYQLMRGVDPSHRGLLKVVGGQGGMMSLNPTEAIQLIALQASHRGMVPSAAMAQVVAASLPSRAPSVPIAAPVSLDASVADGPQMYSWLTWWRDGVHHILMGADHILFLLCLLLPAVLSRASASGGRRVYQPVEHWREAVAPMILTITMFTLAHSITLALAGLRLVSISPKLIEPAIALTIALAAIDNLYPIFRGRRHLYTFLFGLVHGFGFAGALLELNLPLKGFVVALLSFNLGVESGQLLVVLPVLLLLLWVRGLAWYPRKFLPAGSVMALVLALGWMVERVFDVGFMPL
jgi:hypothetical protein